MRKINNAYIIAMWSSVFNFTCAAVKQIHDVLTYKVHVITILHMGTVMT